MRAALPPERPLENVVPVLFGVRQPPPHVPPGGDEHRDFRRERVPALVVVEGRDHDRALG